MLSKLDRVVSQITFINRKDSTRQFVLTSNSLIPRVLPTGTEIILPFVDGEVRGRVTGVVYDCLAMVDVVNIMVQVDDANESVADELVALGCGYIKTVGSERIWE